MRSPDASETPARWSPRRVVLLCLLGAGAVWLGSMVYRSAIRDRAAAELRAMGAEAGAPNIMKLLRTNWRGLFMRKNWEWRDRVRLMSIKGKSLDPYGAPLHRFEPRGVLLGFSPDLEDVSALRGLKGLERLDFYACPKVKDLGIVSEFPDLKELTFANSSALTSLGIIRSGKNLVSLHLTDCAALEDLAALRELTSLRSLFLTVCPAVKDAELLRGLSALEELDLSDCAELANVDGLHGLKALKSVDLSGCVQLTPEAVAALRAALTGAKIRFP